MPRGSFAKTTKKLLSRSLIFLGGAAAAAAAAIVERKSVARHTPNRLPLEGGTRGTRYDDNINSNNNRSYSYALYTILCVCGVGNPVSAPLHRYVGSCAMILLCRKKIPNASRSRALGARAHYYARLLLLLQSSGENIIIIYTRARTTHYIDIDGRRTPGLCTVPIHMGVLLHR